MREIKYRGLTPKGEMVYGSLVVTNHFIPHMPKQHTKTWIVTSAFGNGGWFNIRGRKYVKPETVGQFTGLKDKHGKDIYEGDIVKSSLFTEDLEVYYQDELGMVRLAYGDDDLGDFLEHDSEYFEVIGNIHQQDND